ncbi:MAG: holo-ACP synthase [Clostridia bacterium]|nr:holo-ACP synthase [Clostridia bacterium]
MKIGIDIESIKRFSKYKILNAAKIFSKNEQDYCKSFADSDVHFAGMWCAKESVIKALEDKGISLNQIEIMHKENGAPFVNISDEVSQKLKEISLSKIEISISHTKEYAVATCLIF